MQPAPRLSPVAPRRATLAGAPGTRPDSTEALDRSPNHTEMHRGGPWVFEPHTSTQRAGGGWLPRIALTLTAFGVRFERALWTLKLKKSEC